LISSYLLCRDGIEIDDAVEFVDGDSLPPAFRMCGPGCGECPVPGREEIKVSAFMSGLRRHVANSGMAVFGVVPHHETREPRPCMGKIGEELGVADTVLERLEQRLAVRVIVGDPRSRERRDDPQMIEQHQDCRALHRIAVVGVESDTFELESARESSEELHGEFG